MEDGASLRVTCPPCSALLSLLGKIALALEPLFSVCEMGTEIRVEGLQDTKTLKPRICPQNQCPSPEGAP